MQNGRRVEWLEPPIHAPAVGIRRGSLLPLQPPTYGATLIDPNTPCSPFTPDEPPETAAVK